MKLSIGDFFAKALNFLAFLYLARILGVTSYGIFEFAISVLTYFLLLVDGGLEIWATREAARGEQIRALVARVIPLRIVFAVFGFVLLLILLPVFPDYPGMQTVLILMGLILFAHAVNLKWVFMGQEKMARVAVSLVISQVVFAGLIFLFIRDSSQVIWVPLLWLAGDMAMALYFMGLFSTSYGGLGLKWTFKGMRETIKPVFTIGGAQAMGLMSYNFDAILLGFLLGPNPVGWYRAAYKPITAALAMPLTYFLGLFPALARAYSQNRPSFEEIIQRSLRLTGIFAFPIAVGGTFLAGPLIDTLYGPEYRQAIPALQLLSWSAALIILRDTFRQALIAAGKQKMDFHAAVISVVFNVTLNFVLIPRFGIRGAAAATVLSETIWLLVSSFYFFHYVSRLTLLSYLYAPLSAAFVMGAWFYLSPPMFWPLQAMLSLIIYFSVLFLLGEREVRSWLQFRKA